MRYRDLAVTMFWFVLLVVPLLIYMFHVFVTGSWLLKLCMAILVFTGWWCRMIGINFNTLRLRQNGPHFTDDTFKCIFLNDNVRISIRISLKFVSKSPIYNIPTLVQIMSWRWPSDKPLSEPMMVRVPTHICVTLPQWVNACWPLMCWILENMKIYLHFLSLLNTEMARLGGISLNPPFRHWSQW